MESQQRLHNEVQGGHKAKPDIQLHGYDCGWGNQVEDHTWRGYETSFSARFKHDRDLYQHLCYCFTHIARYCSSMSGYAIRHNEGGEDYNLRQDWEYQD